MRKKKRKKREKLLFFFDIYLSLSLSDSISVKYTLNIQIFGTRREALLVNTNLELTSIFC
jgi:hypothetical protein